MTPAELAYKSVINLLPKGRAFAIPDNSTMQKLFRGITKSFEPFQEDMRAVTDQLTPLNENFTKEDAGLWERRLWILIKTNAFDFDLRKNIILQKMRFPGGIKGRNSPAYMEFALREAGFDGATVFSNRFPDGSGGVEAVNPIFGDVTAFMDSSDIPPEQMYMDNRDRASGGDSFMGRVGTSQVIQVILNTILPEQGDDDIPLPLTDEELRYSFFVSGARSIDPADALHIPKFREIEFREIILQTKPVEALGFLNVIYD